MSNLEPQASDRTENAARLRQQIIAAAGEHFSRYGYDKTTVSDLAREIGFSKAYIYKFFGSKQAIGEAICWNFLSIILDAVDSALVDAPSATEKMRRLIGVVANQGVRLFFEDRKLYEIASYSSAEKWQTTVRYGEGLRVRLETILQEGRAAGEFERKTPADEVCRAILRVVQPFTNPLILQYGLDDAAEAATEVAALILRSLAP